MYRQKCVLGGKLCISKSFMTSLSEEKSWHFSNKRQATLAIYVLLGWLDVGSNEFWENFLLFRVFVETFL